MHLNLDFCPFNIPRVNLPIFFLSFLHQNKALHNFRKRGQRSIVERNMEYALTYLSYFLRKFVQIKQYLQNLIYFRGKRGRGRMGVGGILKNKNILKELLSNSKPK